jgi:DNA recombination protein RmuC
MIVAYLLLAVVILLLIVIIFLLQKNNSFETNKELLALKYKIENLPAELGRIETSVKNEIATNRYETNSSSLTARNELASSQKAFGDLIAASIKDFNTSQKDYFLALLNKQTEQNTATTQRLEQMRETLEKKISEMQTGNEKKLDEMRATVDEKLQKTLETRLGESFKLVSERLEAVHKGLGDMQQLATGVGDLKRVLSNVKTRGVLGEYQLENILEQILTIEQ